MRLWLIIPISAIIAGCGPSESTEAPSATTIESTKGPVTLTVTVDPVDAQPGQQIRIALNARTNAGVTLESPIVNQDQPWGSFHVLNQSDMRDIPLDDGGRSWSQDVLIDTFESGAHDIPVFNVQFQDTRTVPPTSGQLTSESITVQVSSLHDDISQASINDIRGWIMLPRDAWWPWILGAGLLAGVGLWLASRGRSATQSTPPPTAAELARASLTDLRMAGLLERGDTDRFYVRLSSIIRTYIEGRFGLLAPRKTTSEFLHDAGTDAHLSEAQQQQLGAFLQISDLVKFAKHAPPIDQGHLALKQAETFVDETADDEHAFEEQSQMAEMAAC